MAHMRFVHGGRKKSCNFFLDNKAKKDHKTIERNKYYIITNENFKHGRQNSRRRHRFLRCCWILLHCRPRYHHDRFLLHSCILLLFPEATSRYQFCPTEQFAAALIFGSACTPQGDVAACNKANFLANHICPYLERSSA